MASVVDTTVKHFTSAYPSAPAVTGTAGSLIETLDACLVNGYGLKSVDSGTVASGVCRLTFSSGVSAAMPHMVILVAGCTDDTLNGEQRVTAVGNSYVEFATAATAGTVGGTVTFKIAPVGWEKVYAGTNVAVYRSKSTYSYRQYLRVDDTNALYARVVGYETMTDVNTGVGPCPTVATSAGGYYWQRRTATGTVAGAWSIVGDDRAFYVSLWLTATPTPTNTAQYGANTMFFGDLNSFRPGDMWATGISGALTSGQTVVGDIFQSDVSGRSIARMSSALGAAIAVAVLTYSNPGGSGGTSTNVWGSYPGRVDAGLRMCPITWSDGPLTTDGPRGELPGAHWIMQSLASYYFSTSFTIVPGSGALSGRQLMAIWTGGGANQGPNYNGVGMFDITGPWR